MFSFTRGTGNSGAYGRQGKGIAFRLSFWIMLFATLIFMLVLGYYYTLSRKLIVENIEHDAIEMARGNAARIDTVLAAVQKIPHNFSLMIPHPAFQNEQRLLGLMKVVVARNPEVYGTAVAFEPFAWEKSIRHFSPYVYRKDEGLASTLIGYDYFIWDWYKLASRQNKPLWVEPYFDEGAGNIVMSTYSVPFYKTAGGRQELWGIVTVDVSLAWLQKIVSEIKTGGDGYAFLISQKGTFVTHPDKRLILNKSIFSLSWDLGDSKLAELGLAMTSGGTGVVESRDIIDGDRCWLAYAPLSTTGWSIGLVFPRNDLMADVDRHFRMTLALGVLGLAILCGVIIWIARGITNPLRALTEATKNMAAGDLDRALPEMNFRDEVGTLADSFTAMQHSLQTYITDLTKTTAAKERIESELKIAHNIQMSMLPRTFPPFPERSDMDVYAMLLPAREVGGDLYDFFFMDEDHLCFAVGDVSGKGMPAAFHMAITKILIKTKATQGLPPEAILARVNEDLSLDNPTMMFVTVFLGVLNVRTGELVYANGGHPPPYVLRKTGEISALPVTGGMALGIDGDFVYRSRSVMLQKNDTVFIYSDGVTEATDAQYQLFGDNRLEAALNGLQDQPLKNITDGVLTVIEAFAQNEPQTDDITMMAVRYFGD